MIRTLCALAAFASVPALAAAQDYYTTTTGDYVAPSAGLTVQGQPSNAYVITIDTRGKDDATVRNEISQASYTACERAPRTGNVLDIRVEAMQTCVTGARWDANAQFDQIIYNRRQASYGYFSGR